MRMAHRAAAMTSRSSSLEKRLIRLARASFRVH